MLSKEQIDKLDELASKATHAFTVTHCDDNQKFMEAFTDPEAMRELIATLRETQKDLEDANAIKVMIMDERAQWENTARSIVEALGEPVVGLQSPHNVEKIGVALAQESRSKANSAVKALAKMVMECYNQLSEEQAIALVEKTLPCESTQNKG